MKERQSRLKAIKNLIKNNTIESQDELLSLLEKEGYEVTQATLSRDLKLLKVGKVPDGRQGYMYALPGDDENGENEAIYVQDFLRGYLSIDFSGNIVVIKTFPGHANTVCNALDNLNMNEVLGTVAGDNCMFACLREGVSGELFLEKLKVAAERCLGNFITFFFEQREQFILTFDCVIFYEIFYSLKSRLSFFHMPSM